MGFIMKLRESYKNKQQRKEMKKLTKKQHKMSEKTKKWKKGKKTHLLCLSSKLWLAHGKEGRGNTISTKETKHNNTKKQDLDGLIGT